MGVFPFGDRNFFPDYDGEHSERPPRTAKSPPQNNHKHRFAVLHENGHAVSEGGDYRFSVT